MPDPAAPGTEPPGPSTTSPWHRAAVLLRLLARLLRMGARSGWREAWRTVREVEPAFWRNLALELRGGRLWLDRAIVLAFAVGTGAVVVGFTLLAEAASEAFVHLRGLHPWAPWLTLLWTPVVAVAVLAAARRWAPGTQGSGIPQVVRALAEAGEHPPPRLVSLRVALAKIAGVSGSLLAGLSVGREGPTVQVGAGLMASARRWLSPDSGIDARDLMVAGAAAGIAAAFNTPLGGIVFALEQLTRRRGLSHHALVIAAIVMAGLVAVSVFGNQTYFGRPRVQQLPFSLWWPGLCVAVACGLAGGLLARLLVVGARGLPDRFSAWRRLHPLRFAAGCALGVACIGLVTGGATGGAGYATTRALLEGQGEPPLLYTLLKFCATWLSAWSGVPGGVFAPSLAIGAGIGHDVAQWQGLDPAAAVPLVAMGMVGFLAASTGGPITAFIIVMEMVAGQAMVLSLMACALLASGIARLLTPPMYNELADTLDPLVNPPAPDGPGPAPPSPR